MSEHIRRTISDLQSHLRGLEQQIADTKRTINSLCFTLREPAMYADAELSSTSGGGTVRPDLYYGQPLAKVVRLILEARHAANLGPATVNELYSRMVEGGYLFETKNEENAKRILRISLAKNTTVFHRLPGGAYGLLAWYPAVKPAKPKAGTEQVDDDAVVDEPEDVGTNPAVNDEVAEPVESAEEVLVEAGPTTKKKPR